MGDRIGREIDATVAGRTVPSQFLDTVSRHGDQVAVRARSNDGTWREWTFAGLAERVARAATGLRELGVGHGDRVMLLMRNIPEFHVADLAASFLGATPVSVFGSSSREQIEYLVNHCEAKVALVEHEEHVDRFLAIRESVPTLRWLGAVAADGRADFGYAELMAAEPADLDAAAKAVHPDDLATIVYTSGTTGRSKGVMISHRNVVWEAESMRRQFVDGGLLPRPSDCRWVSYLPAAHVVERCLGHYAVLCTYGAQITCCPDLSELPRYMGEVRPDLFVGPPRVWEKLRAAVGAALAAEPQRASAFADGVAAAVPIAEALHTGSATDEQRATWEFLDEVAFRGVRQRLGLDHCKAGLVVGAPVSPDLLAWFHAIGVPLINGYGISEATAGVSANLTYSKNGSAGRPFPGIETSIAADGEILVRSGGVFRGYLHDPDATTAALDPDGWLHTGDIGTIDADGDLMITGRKKELIITSGGENIAPSALELALERIELVGTACVVGDDRPYITALVTLDPDTAPGWARRQGVHFDTLADLAATAEVRAEIESRLHAVMQPFNHVEKVKKVHIVADQWLPGSEVVTPTMKLRRHNIQQRYQTEIQALYD